MTESEEPIDWQWEEDKAKAAISKNVVMSDLEKEGAHRNIKKEFAKLKAQWKEKFEAETGEKIHAIGKMFPAVTDKAELSEAIAQINKEKWESVRAAEKSQREENELDQAARYQASKEQARIDAKAIANGFAQINKENFETIRKAEELQQEEYNSGVMRGHSKYKKYAQENNNAQSINMQRVVVRVSDVENELPIVAKPLKSAIESALFQIDEYRKDVSQNNQLCAEHAEYLEQLLHMLDNLRDIFTQIYTAIPENVETVSSEDAEKVAGYMERFKNQGRVELEKYFSPESIMKGAVPTGIVLTCGVVGSFFGPWGHILGGTLGGIFTKNAKPRETLDDVSENLESSDSDSSTGDSNPQ